MIHLFHVVACFSILIIQTSFIPYVFAYKACYDLLVPFVLYLAIYRKIREGIIIIICIGFIMDNISGGILGLYGMSYIWLYIIARWIITFMHVSNHVLLPLIVGLGIVYQNIFFWIALSIFDREFVFPTDAAMIMLKQVLAALVTGAFFIHCFRYFYEKWDYFLKVIRDEENGNED